MRRHGSELQLSPAVLPKRSILTLTPLTSFQGRHGEYPAWEPPYLWINNLSNVVGSELAGDGDPL